MSTLTAVFDHFDYVMLLFIRVSGILISSPVFGRKNIPRMYKAGFCLIITLVFFTGLPAPAAYPAFRSLFEYALACVKELLFGVAMGFVITTMFNVIMTAGAIMDYQIGYSMASIYDPQENAQTPVTGSLFNIMLLISFFIMDGHLKLIDILYNTVKKVPIGTAAPIPDILQAAVETVSTAFMFSVMVAMPVLAAGIILEIALGTLIKTVPQMNMFVVGIPLKIVIGLVMLAITVAIVADFSKGIFNKAFEYMDVMFGYMSGAA